MSRSSRALIGGITALGLVSSGSAIGYRTRMVNQRREEISAQQAEIDERITEISRRSRAAEASHHRRMEDAKEMENVVTTLWEDRKSRYAKAVRDMESYLVAAPESIGVLQGIIHHCKFLESVLPSFIRFDGRSHQINSLLLTLTAGRAQGISKVANDLVKYHGYDPFVRVLGEHAATSLSTEEAPKTIKEVSDAFAYCHNTLEAAIDAAQSRLVTDRTVVPPSPSLPSQAISAFLSRFKASEKTDSLETTQADLDRIRRNQADLRVLNTHTDVRAALAFSEQLVNTYRHLISVAKTTNAATPFADDEVVEAVKQFDVWRQSVLTFLLQEQAQRALDSYSRCIVDTMTQLVNDGLPEALKDTPATATQ